MAVPQRKSFGKERVASIILAGRHYIVDIITVRASWTFGHESPLNAKGIFLFYTF